MSRIEKIIVPTLERTPARRYINLGALVTMGVPYSHIEYFPARDGQAYGSDTARLVEDALKEGWRLPPQIAEEYTKKCDPRLSRVLCTQWTFTMIFKQIMNAPDDKYYMFLIDDLAFKRPFGEFLGLMGFVLRDSQKIGKPATIVQLDVFEKFDMPRIEREPVGRCASKVLVRGLGGAGDAGLIVNNEGARILYEHMCETGAAWNLEGELWRLAQAEDQSGFYSIAPSRYMIDFIRVPLSAYEQ